MTQHGNPITLAEKKTIIKHSFKTKKIHDNYHKLDRAGQVIILRLRTGHNRLNSHMHKTMKYEASTIATMYLSNRKPDCRQYTPGLPNLHQPQDPDMAGWHITTPATACNHGGFEDYCWLHSANWTISVIKPTRN